MSKDRRTEDKTRGRHAKAEKNIKRVSNRSAKGEKHGRAKLTDEQVQEIRKLYKPYNKEYGTVALAEKYGVTNRVIGLIVNNKAYKNVK